MSKTIGFLVCGSLRIILLAGCLIIAFKILTFQDNSSGSDIRIAGSRSRATCSYYNTSGLILASLGGFGAFYKSTACLKLFVYLGILNAALLTVLFYDKSNATLARENWTLFAEMSKLMESYDILNDHGQSEANRKWDQLQSYSCCGLSGPQDWLRFARVYPSSCCKTKYSLGDFCVEGNDLVTVGCVKRVKDLQDQWSSRNLADIIEQAILYLIAFVLARCYDSSFTSSTQDPVRPVESRLEELESQVERFKAILYRSRRNRYNSSTVSSYLVEHQNYSDPPPAYNAC